MAKLPSGWIFIPKMKNRMTIEVEQKELVMCRDCRFLCPTKDLKMRDRLYCNLLRMYIDDDNYCAWAEKKEGEEE